MFITDHPHILETKETFDIDELDDILENNDKSDHDDDENENENENLGYY
jgi:hypothetical protein